MHLLLQNFHGPKVTCFAFDLRMVDTVGGRENVVVRDRRGWEKRGAGGKLLYLCRRAAAANVARMKTNKVCNVQWKMAACSFANIFQKSGGLGAR